MQGGGERAPDRDEHWRRDPLHDGGIEDRLRVTVGRNRARKLRRDRSDDLLRELMGEHRTEDRNAHGASDVPPELDLARDDAEVPRVDRALRRVQIERHADPNAEPDEHEVAHDLDLGTTDRDLREQVQTDHQEHCADRPEVPVATHANHELAGDEACDDETDHERGDQETRVRRGDAEDSLIDEPNEEDRAEHGESEEKTDRGGNCERRVLPEVEWDDRVRVTPFDDEEDHAHDGRDEKQSDHLGRGELVVTRDRERDQKRHERRGEGERAGEVDVAPRGRVAHRGEREEHDDDGEDADRDVDVEDPAPAEIVGEIATDDGTDDRGDAEDPGKDALQPGALGRRVEIGDGSEHAREENAAEDSLKRAERDELGHVLRLTAESRCDDEADHSGEKEGLPAEEVAELSGDRRQDGRGHQIRRGDPREVVQPV